MDAETIYLLGVRDALIIAGMNKIDAHRRSRAHQQGLQPRPRR